MSERKDCRYLYVETIYELENPGILTPNTLTLCLTDPLSCIDKCPTDCDRFKTKADLKKYCEFYFEEISYVRGAGEGDWTPIKIPMCRTMSYDILRIGCPQDCDLGGL